MATLIFSYFYTSENMFSECPPKLTHMHLTKIGHAHAVSNHMISIGDWTGLGIAFIRDIFKN